MDRLTKDQRSKNMRNVRSQDTSAEIALRRALWHRGYRYRKNVSGLPGKPDIVMTRYRIAIFVDGEFWHGKSYDGGDYPGRKYHSLREQLEHSNNSEFWTSKIERNMQRDLEVEADLNGLGWTVIRFWSRDVLKDPEGCADVVDEAIMDIKVAERE